VQKSERVQLVCDPGKAKKLIAKPQLEEFRIVNENTVLIDCVKTEVKLDKPIYTGFCILELSKITMYDFHNSFIMKNTDQKLNYFSLIQTAFATT
jgi:hypothetical protein